MDHGERGFRHGQRELACAAGEASRFLAVDSCFTSSDPPSTPLPRDGLSGGRRRPRCDPWAVARFHLPPPWSEPPTHARWRAHELGASASSPPPPLRRAASAPGHLCYHPRFACSDGTMISESSKSKGLTEQTFLFSLRKLLGQEETRDAGIVKSRGREPLAASLCWDWLGTISKISQLLLRLL